MENSKPITRSGKIKLLTDIENGKISIKDLFPRNCTVWLQVDETENYKDCKTGKVLRKAKIPCTDENIIVDILTVNNEG